MKSHSLTTIYLLVLQILNPEFVIAWNQLNIEIGDDGWFTEATGVNRNHYTYSSYQDLSQCYRTPRSQPIALKGVSIWNRYTYDKTPNVRSIGFYTNSNCNRLTYGDGKYSKYEIRSVPYVIITLDPRKLEGVSVINLADLGIELSASSWKVIDIEKERRAGGILASFPNDVLLSGSILIWRGEGNTESPTGQQGWEPVTGGITYIKPGLWGYLTNAMANLYLREMTERALNPGWVGIRGAAGKSMQVLTSLVIGLKSSGRTGLQDAVELQSIERPYLSIEWANPYSSHPFIPIQPISGVEFQGSAGELIEIENRRARRTPQEEQLDLSLAKMISDPLANLRTTVFSEPAVRSSFAGTGNRELWMAGVIKQWEFMTLILMTARNLYLEHEFGPQQRNRPNQWQQLRISNQESMIQDQEDELQVGDEFEIPSEKEIQTERRVRQSSNMGTQTDPVEMEIETQTELPARIQLEIDTQTDPVQMAREIQTEEQLRPQSEMETQTDPVQITRELQTEEQLRPQSEIETQTDPIQMAREMQTEEQLRPQSQMETQTEAPPEMGIQTEDPVISEMGMQTEVFLQPEMGIQTERVPHSEMEIQTENFIQPEMGIQTERPAYSEIELQTDEWVRPEAGIQTERPAQSEIELQTEVFTQPAIGIQTERAPQSEIELQTEDFIQPEVGIQTERPPRSEIELQTDPYLGPEIGIQTEEQIPAEEQRNPAQQIDLEAVQPESESQIALQRSPSDRFEEQGEAWPDVQIDIQGQPRNVRIQQGNVIEFDVASRHQPSREQSEAIYQSDAEDEGADPSVGENADAESQPDLDEESQPDAHEESRSDADEEPQPDPDDEYRPDTDEEYELEAGSESESFNAPSDSGSLYEPSEEASEEGWEHPAFRVETGNQIQPQGLLEEPLQREERVSSEEQVQSEVQIQSDVEEENIEYQGQLGRSPPLILFGMQPLENANFGAAGIQNADFGNNFGDLRNIQPQFLDQEELRRLRDSARASASGRSARNSPARNSPARNSPARNSPARNSPARNDPAAGLGPPIHGNPSAEAVPGIDASDYLLQKIREAGIEPGLMDSLDFPGESYTGDDYVDPEEDFDYAENPRRRGGVRVTLPDLGQGSRGGSEQNPPQGPNYIDLEE
ncbi:hypothetical protein TWF718_000488 [Orbilia javanica]|uniref:Uncharacterized protein n=1 Tax=Orbilia javanica TaxID=47235 RepID=A0AAN8RM76_9PEZI